LFGSSVVLIALVVVVPVEPSLLSSGFELLACIFDRMIPITILVMLTVKDPADGKI
jgi:hypothetical protein